MRGFWLLLNCCVTNESSPLPLHVSLVDYQYVREEGSVTLNPLNPKIKI